jgi:hypothetical protein
MLSAPAAAEAATEAGVGKGEASEPGVEKPAAEPAIPASPKCDGNPGMCLSTEAGPHP